MRTTMIIVAALAVAPAVASAQSGPRAYVSGAGGFATTADKGTSGNLLGEAGFKVAPHLFVIGDVGRFHNLQPSAVEPAIDSTTESLSALGVDVTGNPAVPAWYTTGGVKAEIPVSGHIMPFVFGSFGVAHLSPNATFSYTSGTLGDSSPSAGDDVTGEVVSLGQFTAPPSSNAMMFSTGGGVEVPIARQVVVDASYRYSRVSADTPLHSQGLTFGVGYRF